MKLTVKREDLELDIDIEELVRENFLYKESTDDNIRYIIDDYICGLDDKYYYNITEKQKEDLFKEVKQYIKDMEDYNLLDVCKRLVNSDDDVRVDNSYYTSVDVKPLLEYLIRKEESK